MVFTEGLHRGRSILSILGLSDDDRVAILRWRRRHSARYRL